MTLTYILIFAASCLVIYRSGEWIVTSLARIARALGWTEFVVAFLVMAVAASLPNLFVGISSIVHNIPVLSFGDIAGGNLVDLTLAVALAVLLGKKELPAQSVTVQTTSLFTLVAAILPLVMVLDGDLSRIDGFLLIGFFLFYLYWLFSKKEHFSRTYGEHEVKLVKDTKQLLRDFGRVALGAVLLVLAAEGMVRSAQFFAETFHLSMVLIGILIVGVGNALPETYFAISSARRNETQMILGDLMGAVIIPTTMVLGFVAVIHPFQIAEFSPFAVARLFLMLAALFFFFFVKTDRRLSYKEALFLLLLYFAFVVSEMLTNGVH